mmetsp:Transcript_41105/g.50623  ORF Transcript_41105/g.50623 Transcript_41105/m.50623 type:complete len:238 (-) Transcript_41105:47-760(-)
MFKKLMSVRCLSPKDFTSVSDVNSENEYECHSNNNFKIYVGGIHNLVTSTELYDAFKQFGTIVDAIVIPNDDRTRNRGFGFVTFKYESSARKAIYNSALIRGRWCKVNYASDNQKPQRSHFKPKHGKMSFGCEYYSQESDLYRTKNIQTINACKIIPEFYDNKKLNSQDAQNKWDLTILFAGTLYNDNKSLWNNIMKTYQQTFDEISNKNKNCETNIFYSTFITRPLNLNLLKHVLP